MKERLISLREIIIVAAIATIGLIFGSIFDFQIANALWESGSNNIFNSLIAAIGPFFSCIIAVWASGCLILLPQKKTWHRVLCIIGGLAIFAGATWGNINDVLDMTKYQAIGGAALKWGLIAIFACASLFMVSVSWLAVKKVNNIVLFKIVIIILAAFATYYLLNEGIKYLAARPRPRALFLEYYRDPIQGFRAWFQWKPFAMNQHEIHDYYKSFPSAHVQNVAISLIMVPALTLMSKKLNNNKSRIILFYVTLGYSLIIAFSRVWSGAHFLSDVSFGLLLDIAIIFVVQELFLKYYPKDKEEKSE